MLLLLTALTFSILDVRPRQFPANSGVTVINSTEEWKEFAGDNAAQVDFRKNTVVVVFAGERRTGGWSVRIMGVEQSGSECTVRYKAVGPPRGAMVTQAITHPYAALLVNGNCTAATAQNIGGREAGAVR